MAKTKTSMDPRLLETESIPKLLWTYALPAVITTLTTSIYNLIDRIFIGHGAGAMAISGLALSLPIMTFLQAFGTLVGVGASTRISIVLGMKDRDWAERILGNALFLTIIIWAFLHTKTGTAMTAVGSNPVFARASGINVDKQRTLSVIMSTWLGALGILCYQQGYGFIQLYQGPMYMAMPAVSAILIGGASVNKASIANVIIGTILYQGIVTMTPSVMNNLIHTDMSEVLRIIVSNGMILYALTRKSGASR